MLRALLAFVILAFAASAATAAANDASMTLSVAERHVSGLVSKLPSVPCPPQGEDQIDIDKQPCSGPESGNGKTAARAYVWADLRPRQTAVRVLGPRPSRFVLYRLFLHASAPRAPPLASCA